MNDECCIFCRDVDVTGVTSVNSSVIPAVQSRRLLSSNSSFNALDGNPSSVFEPEEEKTKVMLTTLCLLAQTIQQMTLTVLVCLLKTTISQTGIAGFEKQIEIKLAFWTSSSKNLYVRGKCMLFFLAFYDLISKYFSL